MSETDSEKIYYLATVECTSRGGGYAEFSSRHGGGAVSRRECPFLSACLPGVLEARGSYDSLRRDARIEAAEFSELWLPSTTCPETNCRQDIINSGAIQIQLSDTKFEG